MPTYTESVGIFFADAKGGHLLREKKFFPRTFVGRSWTAVAGSARSDAPASVEL
jgi:hypothetical protein